MPWGFVVRAFGWSFSVAGEVAPGALLLRILIVVIETLLKRMKGCFFLLD